MAETDLSLTWGDLANEAAFKAGFGLESDPDTSFAKWTSDQQTIVENIVKRGYRRFLHPPALAANLPQHVWSFLKPRTSITLSEDVTISSATYSSPSTTIDISETTLISDMAGGTFTVGSTDYTISSVTDSNTLVVTGDASAETGSATITGYNRFQLPDDCVGIYGGKMKFGSNYYDPVELIGVGELDVLLSQRDASGVPRYAAVEVRSGYDGSTSTRYDIRFYPSPDIEYTLYYHKDIVTDTLAAGEYALGGPQFADCLRWSVRAATDEYLNDGGDGQSEQRFMRELDAAIKRDKLSFGARSMGYNLDRREQNMVDGWARPPKTRIFNVYDG